MWAILLLRSAVKAGFRDAKEFRGKDYDFLREREGFQRLREAVETKANPIVG